MALTRETLTPAQLASAAARRRRKIALSLIVGLIISASAVGGDYLINVVLLRHPASFTPWVDLIIGLMVGLPMAVVLISQRIDIEGVKERLAHSVADKEAALERMRRSEGLYRLLADNSSDVISLWSSDGKRRYTSPSVERAFGYSAQELMSVSEGAHVHPDDIGAVASALNSLAPGDPPRSIQCRIIRKGGEEAWVESTFSRLDDEEQSLLSSTRVITERKRLEQDLRQALEEARRAAMVKADFLANMTHELRTPLNAIVGFSGLLKGSSTLVAEDARKVTLIADASETLLGIVNDVLDFSKLEAGAIELDHRPFDPRSLANSVLALVAQQAEAKGLALSLRIEGPEDRLLGDGARLGQVLLNFASNAVKFTARGEVELRVTQQDDGERRRLRLAVRDTGIGVPADLRGQIFERFTQADASVSRQYGGTGLGLAICRRIIEAMDGGIGVDSEAGAGSTFWCEVSLPLAQAGAPDAPEAAAPVELQRPLRLLVVDDNAVNRELIAGLLAPFEIDIETAEDGVAAIEAAVASSFDLILMDVQMPVMDGLTATRRIRADLGASPPIIAMTANVLPEQVARCLEAGMDAHIGKPINPRELMEAIARWSEADAAQPQALSAASSLSSPSSSSASEIVSG